MDRSQRHPDTADRTAPESARDHSIRAEQAVLDTHYARLDAARSETRAALDQIRARGANGSYANLMEREAGAEEQARSLARLNSVEDGLCFGRIDPTSRDADPLYIGRIGLRDADHEVLLVDWRAPAAQPFYAATPQAPRGLARRRHLHTRGRGVTGIDDEVFDLDRLDATEQSGLVGEAALLARLREGRTGRMQDIVATIQGEQDQVIRSALAGVLVVQGGPGTGKTVAALHRTAYLLYTHRRTLERRGVLIVGPNPTFLRYIGQVLPALGETDVVFTTVGGLYPGVHTEHTDVPEVAAVKGSVRMAGLLAAAVRQRQHIPDGDLHVAAGGMELRVAQEDYAELVERIRDKELPHNAARGHVVAEVLTALAQDQQRQLEDTLREAEEDAGLDAQTGAAPELEDPNAELWSEEDLASARETLWTDPAVRSTLDELWPALTPQQLLTELFSDPGRLLAAVAESRRFPADGVLTDHEWPLLLREAEASWTVDDVPLLDEAAELLGEDGSQQRARDQAEEQRRREAERYAQGVLEFTGLFEAGMLDAATLAERHRDDGPSVSTAERAAQDRSWAYGHVIVDEAQELSAMAWRTVMRRNPARSLTVVGDTAQTGSAAGATSWTEMLGPYAEGRLQEQHLLVNYRTPVEIMRLAADILAAVAPEQRPPESVRESGEEPRAVRVAPGDWSRQLTKVVDGELTAIGAEQADTGHEAAPSSDPSATAAGGRVAVLVPDHRHTEFAALLPRAAANTTPEVLDAPLAVLTCTQAKGLEFDAVVLVAPDEILEQSPRGGRDLYVAATRATRRLTVLHEAPLPPMLAALHGTA
ncbi:AAA family ATPase [Lipingzhangella sp. LS1_29]|uniref:AAA family ATPase n=1 Tax=Lipingzhangella rawalii TaxID=2055835 RepID=A0ABU2H7L2_9ACTN|nr:ATP-binding domain-containing protein [Lipingzhangella rawalii]MDS1271301.1 AAA family ATPase [Lipingzhangella rawalii]